MRYFVSALFTLFLLVPLRAQETLDVTLQELKRLGEAGYTRLWTAPGELADALRDQGLLTE